MYMLRNLNIRKLRPSAPTRVCTNSAPPGLVTPHHEGDAEQHRAHDEQHEQRQQPVGGALEQAPPAAELRLLDVQQRQAGDRPDVDARAGDVGERRRDDQRDARALELPRQAAQVGLGEVRPGADGDGVGLGALERLDHRAGGAHHGHALDRRPLGAVDAGADDGEAGVRLAAQLADQLGAGALAAHHDDAVQAAAGRALAVQDLPRGVAGDQRQGDREREEHDDVRAGDVELEAERDQRDAGEQPHAGVEDPPELLAAGAEEAQLVGARGGADEQPHQREEHRAEHVVAQVRAVLVAELRRSAAPPRRR